jgi:hypothetical protein
MQPELSKYLETLQKGDKISLVLAGIIVDGSFEELVDGCVVLSDATSPTVKKKHYSLSIPTESIYAWGRKEKRTEKSKLQKQAEDGS